MMSGTKIVVGLREAIEHTLTSPEMESAIVDLMTQGALMAVAQERARIREVIRVIRAAPHLWSALSILEELEAALADPLIDQPSTGPVNDASSRP